MLLFKRKRARDYHSNVQKYSFLGAMAALTVFVICVIVLTGSRNSANYALTATREALARSIQKNANSAIQLYDSLDRRGIELDSQMPEIKQYLFAADALNSVLVETYGEEYSLFDEGAYSHFEQLASEFSRRVASGQSTDESHVNLSVYMDNLSVQLASRISPDGSLLPKTAAQTAGG